MAQGTRIAQAYIQIVPVMENMSANISKALDGGGSSSIGASVGTKIGSGITKTLGVAIAGIGTALAGAMGGIAALGMKSLEAYKDYEQLTGGVETLFGTSASSFQEYVAQVGGANADNVEQIKAKYLDLQKAQDNVMKNAENAYKTSGMSMNDYMETVTSFSASLIQSLGGDTVKASEQAEKAIVDMSDNANKMGTDIEMIKTAYAGFAKQNYTMLDNLKLGYGGTKSEMQRLLADASKIAGVKFNIDSYSDVIEAIHVMQESMGIAGTTAKEAESTIEGSINMMKASWENLLIAFGTGNTDQVNSAMNGLISSITTVASNIVPRLKAILPQLVTGLKGLITALLPQIPPMISEILPVLVDSATQLITELVAILPSLLQAFGEIVPQIVDAIVQNLPLLLDAGLQMIIQLGMGIAESLPTLIPQIVDVILQLVDTIVNNADLLVDAGVALVVGLTTGLINSIPVLIEKAPEIIIKLYSAIVKNIPKLYEAALQMLKTLGDGVVKYTPELINKIPTLVEQAKSEFIARVQQYTEIGSTIVHKILEGIQGAWDSITGWISDQLGALVSKIKSSISNAFASAKDADKAGKSDGKEYADGVADAVKKEGAEIQKAKTAALTSSPVLKSLNAASMLSSGAMIVNNPTPNTNTLESVQVNVTLEGDASALFKSMQEQNYVYRKSTGRSAFA